eukprot:777604-Alexandrium_andersonii.AAC.1
MAAQIEGAPADSLKRARDPCGELSNDSDDEALRQIGEVENLFLECQASAGGWECKDCKQKAVKD